MPPVELAKVRALRSPSGVCVSFPHTGTELSLLPRPPPVSTHSNAPSNVQQRFHRPDRVNQLGMSQRRGAIQTYQVLRFAILIDGAADRLLKQFLHERNAQVATLCHSVSHRCTNLRHHGTPADILQPSPGGERLDHVGVDSESAKLLDHLFVQHTTRFVQCLLDLCTFSGRHTFVGQLRLQLHPVLTAQHPTVDRTLEIAQRTQLASRGRNIGPPDRSKVGPVRVVLHHDLSDTFRCDPAARNELCHLLKQWPVRIASDPARLKKLEDCFVCPLVHLVLEATICEFVNFIH